MKTRTLVLLLAVILLGGLAWPTVHGNDDCVECKALKARIAELEKQLEESTKAAMDLSAAVGFFPRTPNSVSSDVAAIHQFTQEELKAMVQRDSVVVPAKGYAEAPEGGFARNGEDGTLRVTYWRKASLPIDCTLEFLFTLRETGFARMRADIKRLSDRVAELSK